LANNQLWTAVGERLVGEPEDFTRSEIKKCSSLYRQDGCCFGVGEKGFCGPPGVSSDSRSYRRTRRMVCHPGAGGFAGQQRMVQVMMHNGTMLAAPAHSMAAGPSVAAGLYGHSTPAAEHSRRQGCSRCPGWSESIFAGSHDRPYFATR